MTSNSTHIATYALRVTRAHSIRIRYAQRPCKHRRIRAFGQQGPTAGSDQMARGPTAWLWQRGQTAWHAARSGSWFGIGTGFGLWANLCTRVSRAQQPHLQLSILQKPILQALWLSSTLPLLPESRPLSLLLLGRGKALLGCP